MSLDLPIPARLMMLIHAGEWPRDWREMNAQNLRPRFSVDQVRRIAAEESTICLYPPPFRTLADDVSAGGSGDFWSRFGALEQIVPAAVILIADFGLGADAPIGLDYSHEVACPSVIRLRWKPDRQNEWIKCAASFDEFADVLGLGGRRTDARLL